MSYDRRIIRRSPFRRVLAVFPHPDDEAVACGGTLRRLSACGATVTLLLLTKGERGNPGGRRDDALKAIRQAEAQEAARLLGIAELIQGDFPDGGVQDQRDGVRAYLAGAIQLLQPDLVITYDLAGLDGHPDHIACSELLSELRQTRFAGLRLWYVTLPAPLVRLLSLVGQMQQTEWLAARRARPTHCLFVRPRGLAAKMRAVHAYRSQRRAIVKGMGRFFPAWLMVGLQPLEYFAEAA